MPPALSKWQFTTNVWAEKIVDVKFNPRGDTRIFWHLANGEVIAASSELLIRGTSTPLGGYYILFENGYESWIPADVFEAGYRRLEE